MPFLFCLVTWLLVRREPFLFRSLICLFTSHIRQLCQLSTPDKLAIPHRLPSAGLVVAFTRSSSF